MLKPVATLDDLRAAVVRRLETLAVLPKVPVIAEDRQNIGTEIRKALGIGGGLCLTVSTGNATNLTPGAEIPQGTIDVIVEVGEIPAVNRPAGGRTGFGIPAITAAVCAVRALHFFGWCPGKTLVWREMQYDKDDKDNIIVYTLIFSTVVNFNANLGD